MANQGGHFQMYFVAWAACICLFYSPNNNTVSVLVWVMPWCGTGEGHCFRIRHDIGVTGSHWYFSVAQCHNSRGNYGHMICFVISILDRFISTSDRRIPTGWQSCHWNTLSISKTNTRQLNFYSVYICISFHYNLFEFDIVYKKP